MDIPVNWSEFALSEEGPAMPLPRRSASPRNAAPYTSPASSPLDDGTDQQNRDTWDFPDVLAVVGIVAALIGLLLTFFPETRRGGTLVPIGLALMAVAAYVARRKDGTIA